MGQFPSRWLAAAFVGLYSIALFAVCPPVRPAASSHAVEKSVKSHADESHTHHQPVVASHANHDLEPLLQAPCLCGCDEGPKSAVSQPVGIEPAELAYASAIAAPSVPPIVPVRSRLGPVGEIEPIPI
jgi:hypothetical protein